MAVETQKSGLTQAIDFALDVQGMVQAGMDPKVAFKKALEGYSGRILEDDGIKFPDGSKAILTAEGFTFE